jgi:hypothetical protein
VRVQERPPFLEELRAVRLVVQEEVAVFPWDGLVRLPARFNASAMIGLE